MASERAQPGSVIGERYRLDALLGEGAYGQVWRASDQRFARQVALKLVSGSFSDTFERFEREASVAQKLMHPHSVRLLDFGRTPEGVPFLVLELLEGESLAARIESKGPLGTHNALKVTRQILSALIEAHELGIIHRDLKPANVYLTHHLGEPLFAKVLDFGLAKDATQKPLTRVGEVLGTPSYMAPEQVRGRPLDGRADLYAVGLILAEMISGRMVYGSGTLSALLIAQASPRPPPLPAELLHHPAGPLVLKATDKDPAQRFPDARAMMAAVDRLLEPAPHQIAPATHPRAQVSAAAPARRPRTAALVVGALVVVAVVGGVAMALTSRSDARGERSEARALDDETQEDDAEEEDAPKETDAKPRAVDWSDRRMATTDLDRIAKRLKDAGYSVVIENRGPGRIRAQNKQCNGILHRVPTVNEDNRQLILANLRQIPHARIFPEADAVYYVASGPVGAAPTDPADPKCTDKLALDVTR